MNHTHKGSCAQSSMNRHFRFLNLALALWALALVSWCHYALLWTLLAAVLALLAFFLHIVQHQVNVMFGKTKTSEAPQLPTPTAVPLHMEKEPVREEKQNTVIASGVQLTGNITSAGQVHIFGTVTGNIDAKESVVKVMRNGLVEGNIFCRELFIDGTVNGECESEAIHIEENGVITGTLTYSTLTIKKGGTFAGQARINAPVVRALPEKKATEKKVAE